MKNNKLLVFAMTVLLITFLGSCGNNPSVSDNSTTVNNVSRATGLATVDALDITIREASDYLNENIPRGNRIVILNIQSNSHDLSDYIIDELIANAVNDRLFSVVDRQQLEEIRTEQNFQLSGEVDDNEALEIGRFFGAQTIVSGAVNRLGSGYRIRIRALEVQTAQVQGQFNRNIASSPIISSLMESGVSVSGRTTHGVSSFSETRRGTVWEGNGHSYEVINTPITWTQAKRYAEDRGGYLATITSIGEQRFIENLLVREGAGNMYFWLGGFCGLDRQFQWVTGERFEFTNWHHPTQPDNSGGREDKLEIYLYPHIFGLWNDVSDDNLRNNTRGFIIEYGNNY